MRRKRDENEEDPIEERTHKKMLELDQDGKFFDFKFTVRGEQFCVSKLVLSTISPYLAQKLEAEWKFKKSVDFKQKYCVESFSAMIHYIYTYDYEQHTRQLSDSKPSELVTFLFELCHMAEGYEILSLKEQVLEHLPSAVKALRSPEDLYDLLTASHYKSDSESGKLFMATDADNFHIIEAFGDLEAVKPFLVRTPIFAADLVSSLMKRRTSNPNMAKNELC